MSIPTTHGALRHRCASVWYGARPARNHPSARSSTEGSAVLEALGTALDLDPCTDVAADRYAQIETATGAGAWLSASPHGAAFELDLDSVVMRRHDSDGQPLAEIAGGELFGTSWMEHAPPSTA